MTPAQLKSLILALAANHPVRVAFAAGDDSECARLLSEKTQRGPVPIAEIASYCLPRGITGALQALDTIPIGTEIAPGVPMTLQTKGLLKTVQTLLLNDFRLEVCDVDDASFAAACDGLVSLGVMTAQNKTDLIAMGANRLPLAACSDNLVGQARNL